MAYRGDDLDLRTPQSGSRSMSEIGADLGGRGRYGVREPILVDDTLLACCNLAYDLAVTHRAGEVRLEHLVYALTRIDAAAEILESRGVRVAALRREMGSIVASDIPIGLPNGKNTPRRSDEIEMVLRDASDLALRRNAAAGIDDLVTVLVEGARDLPGLAHLRRHYASRPLLDRPDYEPRREPRYEPRAIPTWPEPSAPPQVRTDALQNSRIEALEQAVRSLGSELASERKSMSNLLLDIQRDVGGRRDDAGLIDRLSAIELGIEKRLIDLSRASAILGERIQMMESGLGKIRSEGGGIELVALHDRITGLERALQSATGDGARQWAALADRLKTIDTALTTARPPADNARLIERIETVETIVLERASEASAEATRLAERLKAIEDGQAAQKVQALQLNAGLAAEVKQLADTVAQSRQEILPPHENSQALSLIAERFHGLSAMLERQRAELASSFGGAVDNAVATNLNNGLANTLAQSLTGWLAGSVAQPMSERLSAIGTAFDARQVESQRAIATLGERVAAIERGVTAYMQKVSEHFGGTDAEIARMHERLARLDNQQAALVSGFEQVRTQSGELGVIANRLAAIERLTMRPVQAVDQLSEKVDAIYRIIAIKAEKRNALLYWLFGTDDWIAASWPKRRPPTLPASMTQPRQAPPPATP